MTSSLTGPPKFRVYLEQYCQCNTAAEVTAAQERIIQELEQSYQQSRAEGAAGTCEPCVPPSR